MTGNVTFPGHYIMCRYHVSKRPRLEYRSLYGKHHVHVGGRCLEVIQAMWPINLPYVRVVPELVHKLTNKASKGNLLHMRAYYNQPHPPNKWTVQYALVIEVGLVSYRGWLIILMVYPLCTWYGVVWSRGGPSGVCVK